MKLNTIMGPLAQGYKQLEPESFQTSAELTIERRTNPNPELLYEFFYTSNFGMYVVEEGEAILYFGGREANPIIKNIDEACDQLIQEENYRVKPEDKQAVLDTFESGHTLRVKLSELGLEHHSSVYSIFEINTYELDELNSVQRMFAEAVYGCGDDFVENMKMFEEAGFFSTRIYVSNPDRVKEYASKGESIARVCWLDGFGNNSEFNANGMNVTNDYGVRGVILVAASDAK
jgi:hypothetical protein